MSEVINLNDTTPAAVGGGTNVSWQKGSSPIGVDPESGYPIYDVSAYISGATFGGVNLQTDSYSAVSGDDGKLISFNNGGTPTTFLLLNPPPSATWCCFVENVGTGPLTVSPNGLNIDDDDPALTLNQDEGIYVTTDGTNYYTERGVGGGGGGGSSILLQVNGVDNGDQELLDLVAGTGIVITDDGSGNITIATGVGPVTAPVPRGSNLAGGNNVRTLSVPFPVGTQVGDLAIIFAGGPAATSVPTGWTSLGFSTPYTWDSMGAWKILTAADLASGNVTSAFSSYGSVTDSALAIVTFDGPTGGIRETESVSGSGGSTTVILTNTTSSAVLDTDIALYFSSESSGVASSLPTITPASGVANTLQTVVTTAWPTQSVLASQSMPGGALAVQNSFLPPGGGNGLFALQVIVMGVTSGGGGSSSLNPYHEVPAGAIDGANQTYTLTHTPAANTLIYRRNGIGQGDLNSPPDFTLSGSTITTATPLKPASGSVTADWHDVYYWA